MFLLLASGLVLVGCGGGDVEREGSPARDAASERVGSAGVTVALADDWHATTPDDGDVVDPVTRIVVASSPVRRKETACQVATYDFADDGVALVVLEWSELLSALPKRPERFTSRAMPVQPAAVDCFGGSRATVQFVDHGRAFGAYLLVGAHAPAPLVDEALRVLDTLRVEGRHGDAAPRRLDRNGISLALPQG